MQAALEAAKHFGDADTPSDIAREYQNWLTREMELLAEELTRAHGRKRPRPTSVGPADALFLKAARAGRLRVMVLLRCRRS